MAGIKVSDATAQVANYTTADQKAMYEQYKSSKRVHVEDANSYKSDTLPFMPADIKQNVFRVGRVVGCPLPEFRSNGADAKYVLEHRLVNHTGKFKAGLIFKLDENQQGIKQLEPDKNWFMYRWLYFRLFKFQVDKTKQVKEEGRIVFDNSEHPVFQKIKTNRAYATEKYPVDGSWKPKQWVLLNFIDRTDNWCIENKRTKVLISNFKVTESDGDKPEYVNLTPGLSLKGAYDQLHPFVDKGLLRTTDIAICLNDEKYTVKAFSDITLPQNVIDLGRSGDLTADEKTYEMTDFDPLFNESSYEYIMHHWGPDIKMLDESLGCEDYKELEQLVAKEKGTKVNPDVTISTPTNVSEKQVAQEPVKPEPVQTPVAQTPVAPQVFDDSSVLDNITPAFDFTKFKFFGQVPVDQQALIKEIIIGTDADGNPIFKPELVSSRSLLRCLNDSCTYVPNGKQTGWPAAVTVCPVCMEKLA